MQSNGAADVRSAGTRPAPIVRVRGISKSYPGVKALDDVDLTVAPGEVHALTGENGSGKSTLSKVIAGVVQPEAGTIEIAGEQCTIPNPRAALKRGIVLISQELTLAPTLSVAENIYLGRLPRTAFGAIDWRTMNARAREVLAGLAVEVDVRRPVGELSVEIQQEIEIARAFSTPARILILDEATSSLSEAATARLLQLVARKAAEGVAVLMITHRMAEIYQSCSVATILRDGRLVDTVPLPRTPERELVRRMVGRELGDYFGKRRIAQGEVILEVEGLASNDGRLKPTSLQLRRGEILGIAGLVGSGKAELGQALGGAIPSSGTVRVGGREVSLSSPSAALSGGIGFVPDDRKRRALLPTRSVAENFSIAWGRDLSRAGVLDVRDERRRVRDAIDRYGVVTASPQNLITTLSGGNQQKVVLGRVFALGLDVLVLGEPTRGIDVGAKSEVYRLMQEATEAGAGVIVVSSELPELLGIADRILVFFGGEVRGQFDAEGLEEEAIAHVAVSGAAEEHVA